MLTLTRALLVVVGAVLLLAVVYIKWYDISSWVQGSQQAMQAQLATALQAVRAGNQAAVITMLTACFTYGALHAIGPGHGKVLVSGAAVASRRTAMRMALIGFSASLLQAVSAIALAYGGLGLLSATGGAIIGHANAWLVPASFILMALVGLWIAIRGARLVFSPRVHLAASVDHADHDHGDTDHRDHHHHDHGHSCGAGCKHLPTVHDTEKLENWRDVTALMTSIGVRPCSGALIVLIISWQLGLHLLGAMGALAMAVGTGLIVGLVALFATTIRDAGVFRLNADGDAISMTSFGWIQIVAGGLIITFCMIFLMSGVSAGIPTGLVR